MADKKYVYIQLYPKDLLADEKLAKCDKACAWGAYLALLNIFAMEKIRGCVRLRDWDTHPNNERKSLVANFRNANTLIAKAAAFARVVAKRTPLKVKEVAEGIEQLIVFGVVVMHDDALIQPRMFRESKSQLEGYNPEPDTQESIVLQVTDKGVSAPLKKEKEKGRVAPAPALRANTHTRFESENENNKDSIGSIGGVGEQKPKDNPKQSGRGKTDAVPSMEDGQKPEPVPVADCPPTLDDVKAYMQESGELGRIFRFITAEEYYDEGCKNGWRQRSGQPLYDWKAQLRSYEAYRRNHGDVPVAVREQRNNNNGYETATRHQYHSQSQGDRDRDILEQSARIVERKLRRQEQEQSGSEAGDTE